MEYKPSAHPAPDPRKQTKRERLDRMYFMDAMYRTEYDILKGMYEVNGLPDEWHNIVYESGDRKGATVKITIRLDEAVVKFFKGLGSGYQEKINRVLSAFVHARLAKIVNGPDTSDFVMRPEKVLEDAPDERPDWGLFEGRLGKWGR